MQNTRFAAGKRVTAGWRSARFVSTACALWGMLAGALHAAPNEFQFLNPSYQVLENSPGFVSIPVLYTGGQTSAVTVVCATSGGTPGRYLATTNTLTFNPGEGTNFFTVI